MTQEEARDFLLGYARSRHNGTLEERYTHRAELLNRSCGDRVEVRLLVADGRIASYTFRAQGCALSTASAALAREIVIGLSSPEACACGDRLATALEEPPDTPWPGDLEPLRVFERMRGSRGRHGCVLLAWRAIRTALEEGAPS